MSLSRVRPDVALSMAATKNSIARSNQSVRRLRPMNLDGTKPVLNRGAIRSISGSWRGTVGGIVLLGVVLLPSSSAAQGNGLAERVSQLETQVASLLNALNSERAARQAADDALTLGLNNEIQARTAADTSTLTDARSYTDATTQGTTVYRQLPSLPSLQAPASVETTVTGLSAQITNPGSAAKKLRVHVQLLLNFQSPVSITVLPPGANVGIFLDGQLISVGFATAAVVDHVIYDGLLPVITYFRQTANTASLSQEISLAPGNHEIQVRVIPFACTVTIGGTAAPYNYMVATLQ